MNAAMLHSWWTLALLVIFVGIVVWAFSGKRKAEFDEAARIPLEEDDGPAPANRQERDRG